MKSFIVFPFLLLLGFSCLAQNKPTTKKCQRSTNDRVRKDCIIKEIKKYTDANFNVAKVANFAKIGQNKIYSQFKIDTEAKIVDVKVKASSQELETEATRVIKAFPHLIPSTELAETSESEIFNLLILFNVDENMLKLSANQITDNN